VSLVIPPSTNSLQKLIPCVTAFDTFVMGVARDLGDLHVGRRDAGGTITFTIRPPIGCTVRAKVVVELLMQQRLVLVVRGTRK
jgi:hypothetical protein